MAGGAAHLFLRNRVDERRHELRGKTHASVRWLASGRVSRMRSHLVERKEDLRDVDADGLAQSFAIISLQDLEPGCSGRRARKKQRGGRSSDLRSSRIEAVKKALTVRGASSRGPTHTFRACPSVVGCPLFFCPAPKSIQRQSISVAGSVAGARSIVRCERASERERPSAISRAGGRGARKMRGLLITSRHQTTKAICLGPTSVFCRCGCWKKGEQKRWISRLFSDRKKAERGPRSPGQ